MKNAKRKVRKKEIEDSAREGHAKYVAQWRSKINNESKRTKALKLSLCAMRNKLHPENVKINKLKHLLRESIRKDKEGSK